MSDEEAESLKQRSSSFPSPPELFEIEPESWPSPLPPPPPHSEVCEVSTSLPLPSPPQLESLPTPSKAEQSEYWPSPPNPEALELPPWPTPTKFDVNEAIVWPTPPRPEPEQPERWPTPPEYRAGEFPTFPTPPTSEQVWPTSTKFVDSDTLVFPTPQKLLGFPSSERTSVSRRLFQEIEPAKRKWPSFSNLSTFHGLDTRRMPPNESDNLKRRGYEVTHVKGTGMMADVFRAICAEDIRVWVPVEEEEPTEGLIFNEELGFHVREESLSGQVCAIKVMAMEKYRQSETQVMTCLNHPNVVRIYDHFAIDDNYYIVMEFLNGKMDLQEFIDKIMDHGVKMDQFTALLIIKHVTAGLRHIHSRGWAHMDVHAGNVALHCRNKRLVFKIVDFGSAIRLDQRSDATVIDYNGLRNRIIETVMRISHISHQMREEIQDLLEATDNRRQIGVDFDRLTAHLLSLMPDFEVPPPDSAIEAFISDFDPN